jgi:hypothetical protein
MTTPDQPTSPIYVDPVTGAPLQVDPITGQLTYGPVPDGTTAAVPAAGAPAPMAAMPPTTPLPPTLPLPAGGLPTAFPTTAQPGVLQPPATGPAPQAGYPGYPYPPYYVNQGGYTYPIGGAVPVGRNGLALASMIVSLCGICVGGLIAGLVGAILGHVARRQIRVSGQDGAGMALTGIIVGWALVAIYGGLIAFAISSSAWSN